MRPAGSAFSFPLVAVFVLSLALLPPTSLHGPFQRWGKDCLTPVPSAVSFRSPPRPLWTGGYVRFQECCNLCEAAEAERNASPLSMASLSLGSHERTLTPTTPIARHARDAGPSQILPFLYVGAEAHAEDKDLILSLGITHILNMTTRKTLQHANVTYSCIPLRVRAEAVVCVVCVCCGVCCGVCVVVRVLWRDVCRLHPWAALTRWVALPFSARVQDCWNQNLAEKFDDAFAFLNACRQYGCRWFAIALARVLTTLCVCVCVTVCVTRANGRALIHCVAGISRSPTIAIAYLMKEFRKSLEEAYGMVKVRPGKSPPNPPGSALHSSRVRGRGRPAGHASVHRTQPRLYVRLTMALRARPRVPQHTSRVFGVLVCYVGRGARKRV
jgi:hypothetical protein